MSLYDWLGLALVCSLGAVSPGPSLALVLRHASQSAAAGYQCAIAHAVGVGIYAALAATGLAWVFSESALLRQLVSAAGAAYLLMLAWRCWQAAVQPQVEDEGAATTVSAAIRDGFFMAVLNPKVALFFLAIFAPFLSAGMQLVEQVGVAALAAGIDGLWYVIVTFVVQRSGALQALPQSLFLRVNAAVFLALAVSLIVSLL